MENLIVFIVNTSGKVIIFRKNHFMLRLYFLDILTTMNALMCESLVVKLTFKYIVICIIFIFILNDFRRIQ